jgi:hypothetical protein
LSETQVETNRPLNQAIFAGLAQLSTAIWGKKEVQSAIQKWHSVVVEKVFRIFHSFEESEKADKEYYLSLTPEERLEILFELIERYKTWYGQHEVEPRSNWPCRIIKLKDG